MVAVEHGSAQKTVADTTGVAMFPLNVDFCWIVYEEPARVVSLDSTNKDEPSDENHEAGSNAPAIGVNYWASRVSSWGYPQLGVIT